MAPERDVSGAWSEEHLQSCAQQSRVHPPRVCVVASHSRCSPLGRLRARAEADGSKYEGQWRNDMKHGHGTYVHSDGITYVGQWDEDIAKPWLWSTHARYRCGPQSSQEGFADNSARVAPWPGFLLKFILLCDVRDMRRRPANLSEISLRTGARQCNFQRALRLRSATQDDVRKGLSIFVNPHNTQRRAELVVRRIVRIDCQMDLRAACTTTLGADEDDRAALYGMPKIQKDI